MPDIPVKIERIEKQRKSNGIIHAIAGFYLLVTAITSLNSIRNGILYMLPVFFVGLFSFGYGLFKKNFKDHLSWNKYLRVAQAICFLSLGILYITAGNNWNAFGLIAWGLITVFLFFGERNLYRETNISLNENGINIPGSPTDHLLPWNKIERFTARPDFVTISRHDNKFVQLELSGPVDTSTLEAANKFSRDRIALAIPEK
jgi:hypothetical protein